MDKKKSKQIYLSFTIILILMFLCLGYGIGTTIESKNQPILIKYETDTIRIEYINKILISDSIVYDTIIDTTYLYQWILDGVDVLITNWECGNKETLQYRRTE